jgi:hypothetical protein
MKISLKIRANIYSARRKIQYTNFFFVVVKYRLFSENLVSLRSSLKAYIKTIYLGHLNLDNDLYYSITTNP